MPRNQPRKVRLQVDDVAYVYEGGTRTHALEGLTLSVHDNEFLAVVGPVGCGKTTFLRIVAGFSPDARDRALRWKPRARAGAERGTSFRRTRFSRG